MKWAIGLGEMVEGWGSSDLDRTAPKALATGAFRVGVTKAAHTGFLPAIGTGPGVATANFWPLVGAYAMGLSLGEPPVPLATTWRHGKRLLVSLLLVFTRGGRCRRLARSAGGVSPWL